METIEFKNVTEGSLVNQIISIRFAMAVLQETLMGAIANNASVTVIGTLKDHIGTLSYTATELEKRRWLISNNEFGAN